MLVTMACTGRNNFTALVLNRSSRWRWVVGLLTLQPLFNQRENFWCPLGWPLNQAKCCAGMQNLLYWQGIGPGLSVPTPGHYCLSQHLVTIVCPNTRSLLSVPTPGHYCLPQHLFTIVCPNTWSLLSVPTPGHYCLSQHLVTVPHIHINTLFLCLVGC